MGPGTPRPPREGTPAPARALPVPKEARALQQHRGVSVGSGPWVPSPPESGRHTLRRPVAAGIAPSGLACDSEPRRRPLGWAAKLGAHTHAPPASPCWPSPLVRRRARLEESTRTKGRRPRVGSRAAWALVSLARRPLRAAGRRSPGGAGALGPEPSVPLRASDAPGSCRYYTFTCSGSEPRADRRAGPPAPGTAGPRVPHHVPRHSDEVPGEHDSPGPGLSGDGAGVPTAAKPTQRPPGNPGPAQPEPPSRLPGAAALPPPRGGLTHPMAFRPAARASWPREVWGAAGAAQAAAAPARLGVWRLPGKKPAT